MIDGLTIKTAVLLLGISTTAVGLSLSVLELSEPVAAPASTTATTEPPPETLLSASTEPSATPDPVAFQDSATDAVTNDQPLAPTPIRTAPIPQQPQAPSPSQLPAVQPAPTAPSAPTTAAPTTAAPTTAAPTTQTTAAPTTAPVAASVVTEYLTYSFDGVAEIVIARHDGVRLEFWSAAPQPGWTYMVEKAEGKAVEVKFRRTEGSEGEAKFELEFKDGQLAVKKER